VKELIKCGGTVILSGIIKERLDSVIKVYGDNGFTTQKILSENDWRAVSLIKNTK
jgi:ribosomal protein L11 methylase PrmA